MSDRDQRLREAIAKVRERHPQLSADPRDWNTPTDPYAMVTRYLAEKTAEDLKSFTSDLRRWILGIAAAVIVAGILSIVTTR